MNDLEGLDTLLSRAVPELHHPPDRLMLISSRARHRRRVRLITAAAGTILTVAAIVVALPARQAQPAAGKRSVPIDCATAFAGDPRRPGYVREPPKTTPLPAGFVPVTAYTCTREERTSAGGDRWSVAVEQRADSGFGALLTALRRADMGPGRACALPWIAYAGETARMMNAQDFVLVDRAGRVLRPKVPRYSCTAPTQPAVLVKHWKAVKESWLEQLTSPATRLTGCDFRANYVASWTGYDLANRPVAADRPVIDPQAGSIKICVYEISHRNPDVQAGPDRFISGGTITAPGQISAALAAAHDSIPCTLSPTKWAILQQPDRQWIQVELDGCRRAGMVSKGTLALLAPGASFFQLIRP